MLPKQMLPAIIVIVAGAVATLNVASVCLCFFGQSSQQMLLRHILPAFVASAATTNVASFLATLLRCCCCLCSLSNVACYCRCQMLPQLMLPAAAVVAAFVAAGVDFIFGILTLCYEGPTQSQGQKTQSMCL